MDMNLFCPDRSLRCLYRRWLSDGVKPADEDENGEILRAVYAARRNPSVYETVRGGPYRDDVVGGLGYSLDDASPRGRTAEIGASGVAMHPWVGWLDSATVNGALLRYETLPNPQQLVIAPLSHGGKHDIDVLAPRDREASPDLEAQYEQIAAFFDPLLKDGVGPDRVGRRIRYYTMGEGVWQETQRWPPQGIANRTLHLASGGALVPIRPAAAASDVYDVTYETASGVRTRWQTIGGPDVVYEDQRERDRLRLTYTTEPFEHGVEVTGAPRLRLHVSSSTPDCAVFAYLEDVSPDGRVVYLTEGALRCRNRGAGTGDGRGGLEPSHLREDGREMAPGRFELLEIVLQALSVRIGDGHRIRLAIAGSDARIFEPIPAGERPTLSISTGGESGSHLLLPTDGGRLVGD
jgi:hypothetical protein